MLVMSAACVAALQAVVADTPAGRLGMTICYDLRFPELYQRLTWEMGAQLLAMPSAFTKVTGQALSGPCWACKVTHQRHAPCLLIVLPNRGAALHACWDVCMPGCWHLELQLRVHGTLLLPPALAHVL